MDVDGWRMVWSGRVCTRCMGVASRGESRAAAGRGERGPKWDGRARVVLVVLVVRRVDVDGWMGSAGLVVWTWI